MKMKAEILVARAKQAEKLQTVYMWGAWMNELTNDLIKRKVDQYPSQNKSREAMYKRLLKDKKNVLAVDCCGLIKGIGWGWSLETKPKYNSNNVPDQGANSMFNSCTNQSTDFSKIEAGCIVWVSGHIGIYIGDGLAIEATPKWKDGVQITAVENIGKKAGYNSRKWTKHGKLPYIDYSKPAVVPPPASGGSGSVQVFTHKVQKGETLSAIAKKYLGAANKYPEIAKENNIANPNKIKIGQILKITNKDFSFGLGDRVKVRKGARNYTGVNLASWVNNEKTIFRVTGVSGAKNERVVISNASGIVAAMNKSDLILV